MIRKDVFSVTAVKELNKITEKIIGAAFDVHNNLGPGFIERIYEKALLYEFINSGMHFESQKQIKVKYKSVELGLQQVDFLVENEVIVEVKAVAQLNDIHTAQILSYLKTMDKKLGLLLNFATSSLGIKRVVNKY